MNRLPPGFAKVFAAILAVVVTAVASAQQLPQPTAKQVVAAQRKVATLSPGDAIAVVLASGSKESGTFISSSQEDFTFRDSALGRETTLKYSEVRKVSSGHGSGAAYSSHRSHPILPWIVLGVILVGGFFLTVAAGRS